MIGKTRYTDDSKVTDHYAIIPTGDLSGYDGLNELEEKDIFECIVRRFLAIFFRLPFIRQQKLIFRMKKNIFIYQQKTLIEQGYIRVMNDKEEKKRTKRQQQY